MRKRVFLAFTLLFFVPTLFGCAKVTDDDLPPVTETISASQNAEGMGFGSKDWKSECLSITVTFS